MSADYLQVVLVLGGLGLSALLIYLVSSGRIKNFSVSIKDWFSLKAEGHPSKSVEKSGSESSTQEPRILDQVHRFKRVMSAHGMRPEHWSRFFKACNAPFEIQRTDQVNDDTLPKEITENLTHSMFDLRH